MLSPDPLISMPEEQQKEIYSSPEEEIRSLEQKLDAKKRELQEQGALVEEKDAFREILKEHIDKSRSSSKLPAAQSPTQPPLPADLQKHARDLKKKEEREAQVKHLIELALTRNIRDAVKVAESATPWILDELHDHLVDDFYDKLLALRKLKAL